MGRRLWLQRAAFLVCMMLCASGAAYAQLTFDRGKPEEPLPNPYTLGAKREDILKVAREVLNACSIPVDEEASKASEGRLVTKNVVFTRGVTTRSDLEHLAALPASDVRNWVQGRYSLEIVALPFDQTRSQLQISARVQGRLGGVVGSEQWVDGVSNGTLEDEVLRGLAGKILGLDLSRKGKGQRRILSCEY